MATPTHAYEVEVARNGLGIATYTFLRDGVQVGSSVTGGWDDVTPWPDGTY